MQVIHVYRYMDVPTHTCTHLLQSKQMHIGIYACMKNVKYQKKGVYQILSGHIFLTLKSFP